MEVGWSETTPKRFGGVLRGGVLEILKGKWEEGRVVTEYDALGRSRCLEILEGYGVVPRAWRLLQTYWRRITMVARAGGYYKTAFQGARGVMQGDPLSPTILMWWWMRWCATG